jgi:hypothetical protein
MELGVRQIRTAGKGSGSIELTLPAELRDLVGLPCRVMLRDGSRPDIVLQPDLRRAHEAFTALWQAVAAALAREDADVPPFPLASFAFGLHPRPGGGELAFLCWRDGLALAGPPPHDPAAVSRTMAALGHAMAPALCIAPGLATGFGAACGYVVSGVLPTPDAQEACDLTAAALRLGRDSIQSEFCARGVMNDAFWRHAGPLLSATSDLFQAWTADPSSHATARSAWRRGRSIEMSGG